MKLSEFADILPVEGAALAGLDITGVTSDSRAVSPGMLFFGVAGMKANGAAYAADAARKGAAAVILSGNVETADLGVPALRVDDARRALALAAAKFYGRQPATMVAVTGTSGKTSVASFVRQIWEQTGHQAASIGTMSAARKIAPGASRAIATPVARPSPGSALSSGTPSIGAAPSRKPR